MNRLCINSSHKLKFKFDNVLNMSKMTAVTDIWNYCCVSLNADDYARHVKYLIIIVKTTLKEALKHIFQFILAHGPHCVFVCV